MQLRVTELSEFVGSDTSHDTYLVIGDRSVWSRRPKLRNGRVEIKELRARAGVLERGAPLAEAEFPLSFDFARHALGPSRGLDWAPSADVLPDAGSLLEQEFASGSDVMRVSVFLLHAATRVRKGQRDQLEKLCRYVTRPAICLKRLEVRSDGLISWSLRKAWRDGTKAFLLTPYQLIARLAAIVPHLREHQLTYQGVLAPASPLRDQVVPRPVVRKEPEDADAADSEGVACQPKPSKGQRYIPWAELLKRVFAEDVLSCPRCHGRRHMNSVITDPETVRRVLEGVREGLKKSRTSADGGEAHSRGEGRSPPGG